MKPTGTSHACPPGRRWTSQRRPIRCCCGAVICIWPQQIPWLFVWPASTDTPDPPEGRIERDTTGEPTGILRELAINLVRETVAPPAENQVMNAFEDAAKALHRWGVTGIHDIRLMADKDSASAFQRFKNSTRMIGSIFAAGSPCPDTNWITSSV